VEIDIATPNNVALSKQQDKILTSKYSNSSDIDQAMMHDAKKL
jgi:hypothetical protein